MESSTFQGIVEMDETYFLYSEKGKRKIADRKPRKRGVSVKKRGISNEQVCVLVASYRDKVIFSQTLRWGNEIDIYQFKSDGKIRIKGLYHIQNVNNYHRRLKGWIQCFNGVATKYLNN